jgi:hypothetical protein
MLKCVRLGYHAAMSGDSVPTFRDNLPVPSSRVKKSKKKCLLLGLLDPLRWDYAEMRSSGILRSDEW